MFYNVLLLLWLVNVIWLFLCGVYGIPFSIVGLITTILLSIFGLCWWLYSNGLLFEVLGFFVLLVVILGILLGLFCVIIYNLCILLYNLCVIAFLLWCWFMDIVFFGGIGTDFMYLCMVSVTEVVYVRNYASGNRIRTRSSKVSYYLIGGRPVTTSTESDDNHLYDPMDSRVPNLWLGILPLFCPVDSPDVWHQYVNCSLGLLHYLWQVVQYGNGVIDDLPNGVYVMDEVGFMSLLKDNLDEDVISIGLLEGNLLHIMLSEVNRCSVIVNNPNSNGVYVGGVSDGEPKNQSKHGFWERIQYAGSGGTGGLSSYIPISTVVLTSDFWCELGITPSDNSVSLTSADYSYLGSLLSGNSLSGDSNVLSNSFSVEDLLGFLLKDKLATVYAAADLAGLDSMFNSGDVRWMGFKGYTFDLFIEHMEDLSVSLGFSNDYLANLGSDQYNLFAELQTFYSLDGVSSLVNKLWSVPGTCLLPSPLFINNGLSRAFTVGSLVWKAGNGSLHLFPAFQYGYDEGYMEALMQSYLTNNNYFEGLFSEYNCYVNGLRVYGFQYYIYNMLCGYNVEGGSLSSDTLSPVTDNEIVAGTSVFVSLISSLSRFAGFWAYNVNNIYIGIEPGLLRFDYGVNDITINRSPQLLSSGSYFSLRTVFSGVLGLDGESIEYSAGSPWILDWSRIQQLMCTDFQYLYRVYFAGLCDYYVDYITNSWLKDWLVEGNPLGSPATGRPSVCVGYIFFERLLYKSLAAWISAGKSIMQFPWCASDLERIMLAIQNKYQVTRDAANAKAEAENAAANAKSLGTRKNGNNKDGNNKG